MAQKLKKSKVKPRSQRAIEMEEQKQAAIAAHEAELRRSTSSKRDLLTTIFCWYSQIASVFSVVLGFWGIFSIMAIGFGIAGLRLQKKNETVRKLDTYAAYSGIIVGVIWLIVQIYFAAVRYVNG
jgi:hypothetical protein